MKDKLPTIADYENLEDLEWLDETEEAFLEASRKIMEDWNNKDECK